MVVGYDLMVPILQVLYPDEMLEVVVVEDLENLFLIQVLS